MVFMSRRVGRVWLSVCDALEDPPPRQRWSRMTDAQQAAAAGVDVERIRREADAARALHDEVMATHPESTEG